MKTVTFTHLLTGKQVVILNPKEAIVGLLMGPVAGQEKSPDRTWLILKDALPLPIQETQEEALASIKKSLEQEGQ